MGKTYKFDKFRGGRNDFEPKRDDLMLSMIMSGKPVNVRRDKSERRYQKELNRKMYDDYDDE